jgi:eukaryotic-like serine/threonine-protein kinase
VPTASPDDTWQCAACGSSYPGDYTICPRDHTPRATPAAGDDPLIGAVLGNTYRIVRVLGQGGMARLYEAEHSRIDGRFAVKVIHDDLARDPALIARFEREARAAGRIHSDHVIELIDVLRTGDGRPCLVTELLEGEDLQARLDRVKRLSVAEAVPLARQLCRAVADAHAVGVVHRDLKPSNVFLSTVDGATRVKVLDFGVAKIEDDERLTRTDAVMGTAAYMAPEQARRAIDAGPLSDVYAIGAVLYHVLSGQPPYGNVPAISRFALLLQEEPARPRALESSIPEGLEAVIQHAMARDPAARIQTPLALASELDAFEAPVAVAVPAAAVSRRMPTEHAADLTIRARFTRPLAVAVSVASSLAVGLWIAAIVGVLVIPTSRGERALVGVVAAIAAGALAAIHIRALRRSWSSGPAVARHSVAPARALGIGLVAYGALDLLTFASLLVLHATPFGDTTRLVLAGCAAVASLAWQKYRIGDRLRRRIS